MPHDFGELFNVVGMERQEFIEPIHGSGQVGHQGGRLHEAHIRVRIVQDGVKAAGVGEELPRCRGEQVQFDAGLEALQGRQYGGGPCGMPQPVW